MKQWVTPWGDYYVGDKLHSCDIEVSERPPLTSEQEAEVAKEELARIDEESIRPLRAVMAAMLRGEEPDKADVEYLTAKEEEAEEKREKVKGGNS